MVDLVKRSLMNSPLSCFCFNYLDALEGVLIETVPARNKWRRVPGLDAR